MAITTDLLKIYKLYLEVRPLTGNPQNSRQIYTGSLLTATKQGKRLFCSQPD